MVKACAFVPFSWRSSVVEDVVHLTSKLYDTVAQRRLAALQPESQVQAKCHVNRPFVVLPMDINPGRRIVLCKKLYWDLLLLAYGGTSQFERVADIPILGQASR